MMGASVDAALETLVDGVLASYRSDPRGQHVNRRFLPSRHEILEVVQLLQQLFYPGYVGRQDLTDANL
ncbi:MAG: serine acetyltransferase, partial [Betaproteobacteria bacterium]